MQSFAGREIDFPGLNKNLKTRSNLYSRRSLWVEILYRRQRRPRGGIFGRGGKLPFSAGLHVFFVSRVYSKRSAKKCAFGRRDSCRYSREPIFQSSSEGLSKGSFKYRSLHLLCILSNFKERKRSKKSAQIHLPCLFVVSYGRTWMPQILWFHENFNTLNMSFWIVVLHNNLILSFQNE